MTAAASTPRWVRPSTLVWVTTPETTPSGEPAPASLSPALTAATLVVLLPLGAVVGVLSTTGAGWLTRYWEAGPQAPLLAAVGLLLFLAVLYCACRLCAWGSRRPSGAVAFAGGHLISVIALVGYMPGGDIVLSNHIMHNAYLFGTMLVLVFAVIRSGAFFPAPGSAPSGSRERRRSRPKPSAGPGATA